MGMMFARRQRRTSSPQKLIWAGVRIGPHVEFGILATQW